MLEPHHAPTTDMKQIADFEDQRILVLVQSTVRVGNFPEQTYDVRLFTLVQVVVQELREIMQRRETFGSFVRIVDKLGRLLR